MFGFHLFSKNARQLATRKKALISDETFRRKMETSDVLRHMCGFDGELYQAMQDLGHSRQIPIKPNCRKPWKRAVTLVR